MDSTPFFYYFKKTDGFILLLVTCIAIAALIPELFLKLDLNPFDNKYSHKLFKNIFLLNGIHLICPFIFLFFWPPGRTLLVKKWAKQKTGILLSILVIILLSILSTQKLVLNSRMQTMNEKFFIFFWLLVPICHSIRQSWGISFLMTRSLLKTKKNNEYNFAGFIKWEKITMNLYTVAIVFIFIFTKFNDLFFSKAIVYSSIIFSLLITIYLMYKFIDIFKLIKTNKLFFYLRFFLWPFVLFSTAANWAMLLSHGMEYYALLNRNTENSNLKSKIIYLSVIIFIPFVIFFEYIKLEDLFDNTDENPTIISVLLLSLYPFLTISHYALDSIIYRFKDKDVRGSLGDSLY